MQFFPCVVMLERASGRPHDHVTDLRPRHTITLPNFLMSAQSFQKKQRHYHLSWKFLSHGKGIQNACWIYRCSIASWTAAKCSEGPPSHVESQQLPVTPRVVLGQKMQQP